MAIERDRQIKFHELGTLQSVTRWIRNHEEGLAEWLKNARRAYQSDRANVAEEHRVAVLLFNDARLLCHDQAVRAVQQLRVYAVHNGRFLQEGRPLELAPITPY